MGTTSTDAGPERGNDAPPPDFPDPTPEAPTRADASTALVQRPTKLPQHAEAGSQALTAQIEANVKAKLFLARNFPRNWDDVRLKLLAAMRRPILAEGAMYAKPIGNEKVRGLSIRFAEEAMRTMGNVDISTMLVSDDDDKRVYIVTGMDLETNANIQITAVVTKQIERSSKKPDSEVIGTRTNSKGGKTYILKATSEDDYRAKEMALLQKARRDAILFLTPGDIKEECETQIKETVADRDKKDPEGAQKRMVEAFFTFGVTVAELQKFLGHEIRATNPAEMQKCREILTALKDGEATWADIMEAKFGGMNTGADAKAGEAAPTAAKGAASKIADIAKKGAKAEAPAIPERIQKMIDNEQVADALTDEDREELRQYRTDNPELFKTKK